MQKDFAPAEPIRLLAVDVDGTLIGPDLAISPRVAQALTRARERGVHVVLCTGRSMFGSRRFVDTLELTGFHIFDSGAYVADPTNGTVLYHQGIERSLAKRIHAHMREAGLHLEVYVGSNYYIEEETEHSRIHRIVMGLPPVIGPLADVIEQQYVTKMESIALNDEETDRTNAMAAHFGGEIRLDWATAPNTHARFGNILGQGISKGIALQRLAEHLSIPLSQTMGVGDGLNDEPLLRTAGLGVAMGNAPESIKAIAHWVSTTAAEDGLALAVERFILADGTN